MQRIVILCVVLNCSCAKKTSSIKTHQWFLQLLSKLSQPIKYAKLNDRSFGLHASANSHRCTKGIKDGCVNNCAGCALHS